MNQVCVEKQCVDCGPGTYFSSATDACETDPCTVADVCGGNSCSHDQGSVTCSCSEENYKYDSGSKSCVRDCESNNGGCVDSECINNKCVACETNEYFNIAAEECQTDPCTVADVCGGNSCSHDQGSITCSSSNPCDTAGCSDECSVVDGAAVCHCSRNARDPLNPRLILDDTGKNCGEKFVDKIRKHIRFSELYFSNFFNLTRGGPVVNFGTFTRTHSITQNSQNLKDIIPEV